MKEGIEALLLNLQAFNNTTVFQNNKDIITYGNLKVNLEEPIYVDTLKPAAIEKIFKEFGVSFSIEYFPTKTEVLSAWGGEGKSHQKVFAGRVTYGFVFKFKL